MYLRGIMESVPSGCCVKEPLELMSFRGTMTLRIWFHGVTGFAHNKHDLYYLLVALC